MKEDGSNDPWLSGKSVLIVEDEFIIGLMLIKEIAGAGGTTVGPATSVADALKEIESRLVDAVILDAKLVDGSAQTWPPASRNVGSLMWWSAVTTRKTCRTD